MSNGTEMIAKRWSRRDVGVLLVSAVLLLYMRAHAWTAPLETDECNYLYIGGQLAAGEKLYANSWDHQPPLIFALTGIMSRVCGTSEGAYRAVAAAVSLVTMVLLYSTARKMGGLSAAPVAVLLFALCSSDPGMAGEGGNRELFMNPLILGAFVLMCRERRSIGRDQIFVAGLLLGMASGFKTVVAAQWMTMLLWIWVTAIRRGGERAGVRHVTIDTVMFCAGPVVFWLSTWGYFAITGRSGEFMDAVFVYNLGYSGIEGSPWEGVSGFFVHSEVFRSAWVLWAAGGAGLALLPWRGKPDFSTGVLLMALGSFLAVCLPGRFWPHYYYLMLPWVAIGAGGAAGWVERKGKGALAAWAVAAALTALTLVSQTRHYLGKAPDEIARFRYGVRMSWARDQGRRVARVTETGDSVCVYGSDAGIYYYSGRRCATRFTMIEAVSAEREGVERRREQFMADFLADRPRVVLVTEAPFAELGRVLKEEYELAGWDLGAGADRPPRMQVLMDRDRPIETIDWDWIDE